MSWMETRGVKVGTECPRDGLEQDVPATGTLESRGAGEMCDTTF